jgi:DNA-binding LacI/PurR family transcriptional regulator
MMALGAIRAVRQRGLEVPDDASIVGYDDSPLIAFTDPPLTTVRQPHAGKGAAAIRALLDGGEPGTVLLSTELVVRSSTAPPR